jgi:hypothetical protein
MAAKPKLDQIMQPQISGDPRKTGREHTEILESEPIAELLREHKLWART